MSGDDKPEGSQFSLENIEKKIQCKSPALMSQQVRASIVSNALQKGAVGLGAGLLLRRTFPIYFGTGFALGMAYEQGNQQVAQMNEKFRQDAIEAGKKLAEAHPDLTKFKKL